LKIITTDWSFDYEFIHCYFTYRRNFILVGNVVERTKVEETIIRRENPSTEGKEMRFTIRNTRKGITYLSLPIGGILTFVTGVLIGMFFRACSEWIR
jgi:hypothetical protein